MSSSAILEQNIKLWWQVNFPKSPFKSLVEFVTGQSHPCFLINSEFVLKIYFEGDRFEKSVGCLNLLKDSGFTPKILKTSLKDDLNNPLGGNCILMEYISGENLAENLAKSTDQQKYDLGQKVAQMIQKIHNSKISQNQSFNTAALLDLAQKASMLHRKIIIYRSKWSNLRAFF